MLELLMCLFCMAYFGFPAFVLIPPHGFFFFFFSFFFKMMMKEA